MRRVSPRCSSVRRVRVPRASGTSPVSALPRRSSAVSWVSWPSAAGSGPVRPCAPSRSPVTRWGVPPTVTPVQALSARVPSQLRRPGPASASRAASKAVQSCTRPVFVVGLGTVTPLLQGRAVAGAGQVRVTGAEWARAPEA